MVGGELVIDVEQFASKQLLAGFYGATTLNRGPCIFLPIILSKSASYFSGGISLTSRHCYTLST